MSDHHDNPSTPTAPSSNLNTEDPMLRRSRELRKIDELLGCTAYLRYVFTDPMTGGPIHRPMEMVHIFAYQEGYAPLVVLQARKQLRCWKSKLGFDRKWPMFLVPELMFREEQARGRAKPRE